MHKSIWNSYAHTHHFSRNTLIWFFKVFHLAPTAKYIFMHVLAKPEKISMLYRIFGNFRGRQLS